MASLSYCRGELQSIISEIRSIESEIRSGFEGIGEDLAADCVGRVADKYETVLGMLNRVDTNRLAEWILEE